MISNSETLIIYFLESVDYESKTGVLKLKEEKRYSHWKKLKVSISPLLLYRIKNRKHKGLFLGDKFIGNPFKSNLNSDKYYENPFRLIEFVPDEHSDIPRNYRLELVFEMFSEKIERLNAFHKPVVVGYKSRVLKPSQYIRFKQLVVTKKLLECKRKLSFNK